MEWPTNETCAGSLTNLFSFPKSYKFTHQKSPTGSSLNDLAYSFMAMTSIHIGILDYWFGLLYIGHAYT